MVQVLTLRQNLNFVAISKHTETYGTIGFWELPIGDQRDGQRADGGGIEPSWLWGLRGGRVGVGGGGVRTATTETPPVDEDEGNGEDDGEESDDVIERAATDLEIVVFELGEVPVEGMGLGI
ncbi:hypothetical protein SLA2020_062290 [Shorea laevis]